MKSLFLLLFSPFIAFQVLLAQNLVPNPSFEEFSTCPSGDSQLYRAINWTINVNTADYFNECADTFSQVSIPSNGFGVQYPFSGNAYAGHFSRAITFTGSVVREFLGCKLTEPLIIGEKYYVSFYANLSNTATCVTNKLGVLFTNVFFGDTILFPIPLINNFAHIYSDSLLPHASTWTSISGSFIADSAYQYLMIGNFFDDSQIDSVLLSGTRCGTYYYIDQVCVSLDSLLCAGRNDTSTTGLDTCTVEIDTCIKSADTCTLVLDTCIQGSDTCIVGIDTCTVGITENYRSRILLYPNPATGFINVSASNEFSALTVYDSFGNKVYGEIEEKKHAVIDVTNFPGGIYLMKIESTQTFQTIKFLVE